MLGYLTIHGVFSTWFINSFHQITPLHRAANAGHLETVRCLAEKGAVINIKDKMRVSK